MVRALACRHVPVVLRDHILAILAHRLVQSVQPLIRLLLSHILARPVPQDLSASAVRHLPPLVCALQASTSPDLGRGRRSCAPSAPPTATRWPGRPAARRVRRGRGRSKGRPPVCAGAATTSLATALPWLAPRVRYKYSAGASCAAGYTYVSTSSDWNTAALTCNAYHNGWLATVNNASENTYLSTFGSTATKWIGANDVSVAFQFVWLHGTSSFTSWYSGNPNGASNGLATEKCATTNWGSSGKWGDSYCRYSSNPFVCENDVITSACSACPAGSAAVAGSSSCTCLAGYAQAGWGPSLTCTSCAAGTYSIGGSSSCIACPSGSYSSSSGSSACLACGTGTGSSTSLAGAQGCYRGNDQPTHAMRHTDV
jgi:hypothetical protein